MTIKLSDDDKTLVMEGVLDIITLPTLIVIDVDDESIRSAIDSSFQPIENKALASEVKRYGKFRVTFEKLED